MENIYKTKKIKKISFVKFLFLLGFIFGFFSIGAVTHAANMSFSPSSGSYKLDSNLSVNIYISSDQSINAASGVITFPKDKLEVTSLSKNGSIFTFWVQEPSFSNNAGTVNFEGIIMNPGFTGSNGKVITVNFKVKTAGVALLNFFSGSILANDGEGTNVLTSLGNAQFSLANTKSVDVESKTPTTPANTKNTPASPRIFSSTHPDPDQWYVINNPQFTWSVPLGITGVRLLVDEIPQSVPTITYIPAISSKKLFDLSDGIWYFHVRLKNNAGWGDIAHFRFQIDTEKPSYFEIQEIKREDLTNPKVKFSFDVKDETSGIDHYEIQIDKGNPQVWQDGGGGIYETPQLDSGNHILFVKAIDKAENFLENFIEFTIESLEPPVITEYSKELQKGKIFIKGTTYPNTQVILWLQKKGEEIAKDYIVESDKEGNFIFISDGKLKEGTYKLWAGVVDKNGAKSKYTKAIIIKGFLGAEDQTGDYKIRLLCAIILFITVISILIFFFRIRWYIFSSIRKKPKKKIHKEEQTLHNKFNLIKKSIDDQIEFLEETESKRELTKEEEKIIEQLRKNLKNAGKFTQKKN